MKQNFTIERTVQNETKQNETKFYYRKNSFERNFVLKDFKIFSSSLIFVIVFLQKFMSRYSMAAWCLQCGSCVKHVRHTG